MNRVIQIENNTIIRQVCLQKDEYALGRGPENSIFFNLPAHSETSWESLFSHSTIARAVKTRKKVFIRMDENKMPGFTVRRKTLSAACRKK